MTLNVKTSLSSYNITVLRGAVDKLKDYIDTSHKALIVTDDGVPEIYSEKVASQFKESVVCVFPNGEKSKNIETFKSIIGALCENNFTRSDCIVAVGGGVVGDVSGFAASAYMRGIDFYNIPTTLLSQVDSSIGGKTAVDFMGYKNIVGAFYQPKAVIIDPDVLKTLPARQFSNGLAESIKMALTSDKELFRLLETNNAEDIIDTVIERSLLIKKDVVEKDEKEASLRKVLNFGHTFAHAIESVTDLDTFYHGECVALGMLPMCSESVRKRLVYILMKNNLPASYKGDIGALLEALKHDKKAKDDGVDTVFVENLGSFEFCFKSFDELENILKGAY